MKASVTRQIMLDFVKACKAVGFVSLVRQLDWIAQAFGGVNSFFGVS